VVIGGLVVYPAFYALYLATLNKAQTRFVGLDNFRFLFGRDVFQMVVRQVVVFAVTAVFFKAILGFIAANLVNNLPQKGQRKWRGMMLVPWVIPPALSTLGWWWMFDPTYSALNWLLAVFGGPHIPWLSEPNWARFCVILVNTYLVPEALLFIPLFQIVRKLGLLNTYWSLVVVYRRSRCRSARGS
jgi:multiple sugar transport system permease protein